MATYPRPPSIRIHYFASLLAALLSISTYKAVKKGEHETVTRSLLLLLPYPWPVFSSWRNEIHKCSQIRSITRIENPSERINCTLFIILFKNPALHYSRLVRRLEIITLRDYCPIIQVSLNRFKTAQLAA